MAFACTHCTTTNMNVDQSHVNGMWIRAMLMECGSEPCQWNVDQSHVNGMWIRAMSMECGSEPCQWNVDQSHVNGMWSCLQLQSALLKVCVADQFRHSSRVGVALI